MDWKEVWRPFEFVWEYKEQESISSFGMCSGNWAELHRRDKAQDAVSEFFPIDECVYSYDADLSQTEPKAQVKSTLAAVNVHNFYTWNSGPKRVAHRRCIVENVVG